MKLEAIAREVWANVTGGTARVITLTLLAAAVGAGLAAVDVSATRRLIADGVAFREAGAATLTVTAEGRIDGEACRTLGALEGVLAAGALRQRTDSLVAGALPSAPITAYETTPGFADLLDAEGGGLIAAQQVSAALGLAPGAALSVVDGSVALGGVYQYPDDGRRPGFGWAAFVETVGETPFDECWVLVWPQSDVVRALLPGVAAPGGDPPQLAQLNSAKGSRFDGHALLESRMTSWAPLVAGLLVGGIAFASIRRRRLAIASDLHAGAKRRDLTVVAIFEGMFWLTASLLITMGACALLAAPESVADRGALLVQGSRVAVAAYVGGCAGLIVGVLSVRESHLLRYFKDR